MATTIDAQGRTVDEAIQIALNQLGASRDKVEIEIIHHPRRGFLGIGARRAKVRATLRQGVMLDGEEFDMSGGGLQEKPRRRRRRGGKGRGRGESETESSASERPEVERDRSREGDRGRRGGDRPADGESRQSGGRGREDRRGRGEQQRGRDESRGGGRGDQRDRRQQQTGGAGQSGRARGGTQGQDPRPRPEPPAQAPPMATVSVEREPSPPMPERPPRSSVRQPEREVDATISREQEASGGAVSVECLDPAVIRDRARELVAELIAGMGFSAEIASWVDEATHEIVVSVRSESEGLLIGRRGQTLDALEHVINRMVLRGEGTGEGRVLLDIGDYRRRRRETLIELADRLRTRALGERRTVQVSPMSPRDRKFFQQALAADSSVEVRALGAGFYRRMIVAPAGMGPAALAEAEAAARSFGDEDAVDELSEAFSSAESSES
ncbi:MAG: Jag N-terminal domain-containing protein [Deltaproteobacteria bacterium]|nr:Jag N-terminal domain-containing protein [Deltaproteobacteria bacterium]